MSTERSSVHMWYHKRFLLVTLIVQCYVGFPGTGISRKLLLRLLWGEHYINTKSKRIYTQDKTGKLTPMFVQFVLKNIWDVYNAVNNK